MKIISYTNIKQIITRELLISEGFFGNPFKQEISNHIKSHFLGFRKGFILYDIEKSIVIYAKVIRLIHFFDISKLRILFIGSPNSLKEFVPNILARSRHSYISNQDWIPGMLSNKKDSPDLIVRFKNSKPFYNKECFNKRIPLISFVDESSDISYVDYPIMVNLKSAGAAKMYLYLIKLLTLNVKY